MRMWGVDPRVLCQKHLLGEHVELHMFVGTIRKGVSLGGYLTKGLLEPHLLEARHRELVAEMESRGIAHRSPLQTYPAQAPAGKVDRIANLDELQARCPECRKRIQEQYPTTKATKEAIMADKRVDVLLPGGSEERAWEGITSDGVTAYFKGRDNARKAKEVHSGDLLNLPGWIQGARSIEALEAEGTIELPAPYTAVQSPILPEHVALVVPEETTEIHLTSEQVQPTFREGENPQPTKQQPKESPMAHEITPQDNIALYRDPAWHGIGNVVPSEMSPMEAMAAADLDWEVAAVRPTWSFGGVTAESTTAQVVLRIPREGRLDRAGQPEKIIELGKTGPDWSPIQNREMFALAEAGAGMGVKIESAGSLSQGRRVFALLRADSFVLGGGDQVWKYLLLCMGHDGELTLRAQPTSIRVVCKNTLRMAIKGNNFFSIRHTGDIKSKLLEMAAAIQHFRKTGDAFEDACKALHKKHLREAELKSFWEDAWVFLNGKDGEDGRTPRRAEKAKDDLMSWQAGMEVERMELGGDVSLWLAMNAVTRHIQHREPGRTLEIGRQFDSADIRMRENLMGWNENRSAHIFKKALALV